jgi:hypothetical protein
MWTIYHFRLKTKWSERLNGRCGGGGGEERKKEV